MSLDSLLAPPAMLLVGVFVVVLYVVVKRRKQGEGAVIELEKSPSWL